MITLACPKCRGNMIYPQNRGGMYAEDASYKCVSCSLLFRNKRLEQVTY